MFCHICGFQAPEGAGFCPKCGTQLVATAPPVPSPVAPPVSPQPEPAEPVQLPPEPTELVQPLPQPPPARTLTLSDVIFPGTGVIKNLALVVGFALLTAVLARLTIDLTPWCLISGETLGILLSGVVLGSRRGALSQVIYVGAGALGVPVFAVGQPELPHMLGPSSIYLLGFVAAAYVVGILAERGCDRRIGTMFKAMLVGIAVLHAFNVASLSTLVPLNEMLTTHVFPRILGDLIQIAIAAIVFPLAWTLLRGAEERLAAAQPVQLTPQPPTAPPSPPAPPTRRRTALRVALALLVEEAGAVTSMLTLKGQ